MVHGSRRLCSYSKKVEDNATLALDEAVELGENSLVLVVLDEGVYVLALELWKKNTKSGLLSITISDGEKLGAWNFGIGNV